MWKDVTSYSQSDKERLPNCFEVNVRPFRIVLVWNHRYCPDTWSTSIHHVYENYDLKLSSYSDIELAKRKALELAEKTFSNTLAAIQKESANASHNSYV